MPIASIINLEQPGVMQTLAEIEEAIMKLSSSDFRELLRRLNERREESWDREIEDDAARGKFDALWTQAEKEMTQGDVMSLDKWMALEEALSLYSCGALSAGEMADFLGITRAELESDLCTRHTTRPYSKEEIMRDLAWAHRKAD